MLLARYGLVVVVTVIATACVYMILTRSNATSLKAGKQIKPIRILLVSNPNDIAPPDALQLRKRNLNSNFSDYQNVSLGVAAQSWEAARHLDNPIRLVRGDFEDLNTTRDLPHVLFGVYDYNDTVKVRVAPFAENWKAKRGRIAHVALNRTQAPIQKDLEILLERALAYALGQVSRDELENPTDIKLCFYN